MCICVPEDFFMEHQGRIFEQARGGVSGLDGRAVHGDGG